MDPMCDLDDWNPMEEDYQNHFNFQHSFRQNSLGGLEYKPFLYVANIPRDFNEQSLRQFFSKFGNVKSVRINQSGPDFFYGFINYGSIEEALRVFSLLKNVNTFGMVIRIGTNNSEKSRDSKRPLFNGPIYKSYSDDREKVPLKITTNTDIECAERQVSELPVNSSVNGISYEEFRHSGDEYYDNSYTPPYDETRYQSELSPPHSNDFRHRPQAFEVEENNEVSLRCLNDKVFSCSKVGRSSSNVFSEEMAVVPFQQGNMVIRSHSPSTFYPHADCCRSVPTHCSHGHGYVQPHCCHNPSFNNCCSSASVKLSCCHSGHAHDPSIPPLKSTIPLCSHCKDRFGAFVCTNCSEPYCSRECQEADWKHHKVVCRLRQIAEEESFAHNERSNHENDHDEALTNGVQNEHKNFNNKPTHNGKGLLDTPEHLKPHLPHPSNQNSYDSIGKKKSQENLTQQKHSNYIARDSCVSPKLISPKEVKKPLRQEGQTMNKNFTRPFERKKRLDYDPKDSKNLSKVSTNKTWDTNDGNAKSSLTSTYKDNAFRTEEIKESKPFPSQNKQSFNSKPNMNAARSEIQSNQNTKPTTSIPTNATKETESIIKRTQNNQSSSLLAVNKIKITSIKATELSTSDIEKVTVCYVKNPNEFYVQRMKDEKDVNNIVTEMLQLAESKAIFESPAIDNLCGALFADDNNFYRAQITKVFDDNTVGVYFIDYGNLATVKNSDLRYLTSNLGNYPAMAVKCKLANLLPKNKTTDWSLDAVQFFVHMVTGKSLGIDVISKQGSCHLVDLTHQGISVSEMLIKQNFADNSIKSDSKTIKMKTGTSDVSIPSTEKVETKIPVILEKLKTSAKYCVDPTYFEEDKIWGIFEEMEILQKFAAMSENIAKANTRDVMTFIEENDFAAALSPTDKGWYRCVVKQRKKNSFVVHYIDFGNKEEVTILKELTPENMNVCSPLLCFKVKDVKDFSKLKEHVNNSQKLEVTVKSITKSYVEMETIALGHNVHVIGFPWFSDMNIPTSMNSILTDSAEPNATSIEVSDKEKLHKTEKILIERELNVNVKTPIFVSWVHSSKEIYVQKINDSEKLNMLKTDIDAFCSINKQEYSPIEGEIVCARYSDDNSWYRSLVVNVLPDQKFVVLFIDYGNEEEITLKDIRCLDDSFTQPIFTISVSLFDAPSDISNKELTEKLLNKVFDLQVVDSKITPQQVILYNNGAKLFPSVKEPSRNMLPYEITRSAPQKPPLKMPIKKKHELEIPLSKFDGGIVKIKFIDSSKNFHIQLVSDNGHLHSMENELIEFWKKNPSVEYHPEVDDVVCVRWKNTMVRGCITEVQGESCVVKFIDREQILEIVVIDIFPLPLKFFYPVFMISVKLHNVPNAKLTDEVCQKIEENSHKLQLLDKNKEPFQCKMYLNDECINDKLVKKPRELTLIHNFQKQSLPLNNTLEVIFFHVEKESGFYFLQLSSDSKIIADMQSHYQNLLPLEELPNIGEVVCAKFSLDGMWYRASVNNVDPIKKNCDVTFIDYGNGEEVSSENLRILSPELISIPTLSIRVKITNGDNYPIKMGDVITVTTSGTVENPTVSIVIPDKVIPHSNNGDISTKEAENSSSSSTSSAETAIFKNEDCKFELNNAQYVEFPLGNVQIVIFHVEGEYVFCTPFSEANIMETDKLVDEMTKFVNNKKMPCYKPEFSGELVMAKFADDNRWYRGTSLGISGALAEIVFIDYGNSQLTKFDDIRKMDAKFMSFPVQAVLCKLEGFIIGDFIKVNNIIRNDFINEPLDAVHAKKCYQDISDQDISDQEKSYQDTIEIPLLTKKLEELGLVKLN